METVEDLDWNGEPSPEQVVRVTDWLERAGYRVIRPLRERTSYCEERPPGKLITAAILDVETTGTNHQRDKIIELGIVLVEVYPKTGQVYRVLGEFDELEDPGIPIPEEASRINHITDAMVSGKRISDEMIESLMSTVAVVIAHNAEFDRKFAEERFPIFATKAWACSLEEVPWAKEGISSAKLEFLAYSCGFHFKGHRAASDCYALLEVLQQPLPSSKATAMQVLLGNARLPDFRVSALGSPFESKDFLKERGYRWNPDKKVWASSVSTESLDEEVAWLREFVYRRRGFQLELEKMTVMNRFSSRPGKIETVRYD
jgi:DNA polymerase-3 subunit epsilon